MKRLVLVCCLGFLLVPFVGQSQVCPVATSVSLITNGNFESGNVGFSSGYGYASPTIGQGQYTVGTNPNPANTGYFATMGDHTSGSGNMMIIDVNGTLGISVWQTTVSGITANTNYFFSGWFANIENMTNGNGNLQSCVTNASTCPNGFIIKNSPRLQFKINNAPIGNLIYVDSLSNGWDQGFFLWNSGTTTGSTVIQIQNLLPTGGSNDMALDDVFFGISCANIQNLNTLGRTSAVPSTVSLCAGGGQYTMDPQLTANYGKRWKNSALTQLSTAPTFTATTTGTYYLCYDTIPGCYRTDTIQVINTLSVNIGNNQNLCNPISTSLLTGVTVPPCTVTWFLNGSSIAGANGSSLFVNQLGSYYAVVRSPGCATATSNSVNITSSAPTPTNATFCSTSTVNLSVSPTNSGRYKWWNSATGTTAGNLLKRGGNTYALAVSGTTNFTIYAEDTSVAKVVTGDVSCGSPSYSGWSENLQNEAFLFNVNTPFLLDSISVPISGPASGTFSFRVNIVTPSSGTITINATLNGAGSTLYRVPLGGISLATGVGYRMDFTGSSKNLGICTRASGYYPQNFSPYFSITYNNTPIGWSSYNLIGVKDWVIRTGTICARVPVVASYFCALPSYIISLVGKKENDEDVLTYRISNINFEKGNIQKSDDGFQFYDIASIDKNEPYGNVSLKSSGKSYYRILIHDAENKTYTSQILALDGNKQNYVVLYPNPTEGYQHPTLNASSPILSYEIYDQQGRKIEGASGNFVSSVEIQSKVAQGAYVIKVSTQESTQTIPWVVLP